MSAPIIGQIHAGTAVVVLAKVLGNAGAAVSRSSINSITYDVYEVSLTYRQIADLFGEVPERDAPQSPLFTPKEVVKGGTLVVDDVIFDTYQLNGGWTADEEGFNFRAELPIATFPPLSLTDYPTPKYYEVSFRFTPATGGVFGVRYVVRSGHFLAGVTA